MREWQSSPCCFNMRASLSACLLYLFGLHVSVNLFPAQPVCQSVVCCLLDKEIERNRLCLCVCPEQINLNLGDGKQVLLFPYSYEDALTNCTLHTERYIIVSRIKRETGAQVVTYTQNSFYIFEPLLACLFSTLFP